MKENNNTESSFFQIDSELRQKLITALGSLEKEKLSLQQSLRKQKSQQIADQEELFLELLDIFDALDSLQGYMKENPELPPRFVKRLPRSITIVQNKLLGVLGRRDVQALDFDTSTPNFEVCRVVEREDRKQTPNVEEIKIVRQGFRSGEKILRPVEVIIYEDESST